MSKEFSRRRFLTRFAMPAAAGMGAIVLKGIPGIRAQDAESTDVPDGQVNATQASETLPELQVINSEFPEAFPRVVEASQNPFVLQPEFADPRNYENVYVGFGVDPDYLQEIKAQINLNANPLYADEGLLVHHAALRTGPINPRFDYSDRSRLAPTDWIEMSVRFGGVCDLTYPNSDGSEKGIIFILVQPETSSIAYFTNVISPSDPILTTTKLVATPGTLCDVQDRNFRNENAYAENIMNYGGRGDELGLDMRIYEKFADGTIPLGSQLLLQFGIGADPRVVNGRTTHDRNRSFINALLQGNLVAAETSLPHVLNWESTIVYSNRT